MVTIKRCNSFYVLLLMTYFLKSLYPKLSGFSLFSLFCNFTMICLVTGLFKIYCAYALFVFFLFWKLILSMPENKPHIVILIITWLPFCLPLCWNPGDINQFTDLKIIILFSPFNLILLYLKLMNFSSSLISQFQGFIMKCQFYMDFKLPLIIVFLF